MDKDLEDKLLEIQYLLQDEIFTKHNSDGYKIFKKEMKQKIQQELGKILGSLEYKNINIVSELWRNLGYTPSQDFNKKYYELQSLHKKNKKYKSLDKFYLGKPATKILYDFDKILKAFYLEINYDSENIENIYINVNDLETIQEIKKKFGNIEITKFENLESETIRKTYMVTINGLFDQNNNPIIFETNHSKNIINGFLKVFKNKKKIKKF